MSDTTHTPTHLHTCSACGEQPDEWQHNGFQEYPAKYKDLPSMKRNLDNGNYVWVSDDTFGVDLYTCSNCGSTTPDTVQETK